MKRTIQPSKKTEIRKIHDNLLSDGKHIDLFSAFVRLAETSYGPHGRLKFLHTYAGGHVTVTTSSTQIINHLIGTSHPVLRLIMMAAKGHLDVFNDGGLTLLILIIRLVESSIKLDVPRSVILEVISDAQENITKYLTSPGFEWKIKVDIGDIKTILCLIRGVLGTKPACSLTEQEKEFLSTVLLKAFLESVPSQSRQQSSNPIQFLPCEGSPVTDTKVFHGVLLEAPDLQSYSRRSVAKNLKVALYNISMAGDTDEWTEGIATVAMGGVRRDELSNGILKLMKSVVAVFMKESVGLVACQKVIHPELKTYLREKGIYVIDRLSVLHIGAVQRLTGAKIISTFTKNIPSEWFGFVGSIEHTVLNNKSYLHILPATNPSSSSSSSPSCPVTTLVLCAPNETSLSELKIVCQSVISTVQGVISSPYVVPGGGCLETHLAWYLRWSARHCDASKLDDLGCTKAQYVTVINTIARCLETIAKSLEHDGGDHVTDSTNHHHWILSPGELPETSDIPSCICGLVSRDQCNEWCILGNNNSVEASKESCRIPSSLQCITFQDINIMDLHLAKVSLLQAAFETASVILRVKHLVAD